MKREVTKKQNNRGFNKKSYIIKLCIGLPLVAGAALGAAIGMNYGFGILQQNIGSVYSFIAPTQVYISKEEGDAVKENGVAMARQIVREGSVLVKNDNNVLPLKKAVTNKVNVFGHGSIDWIVGGSGSGQCGPESKGSPTTFFLPALEEFGVSYNTELSNYYKNFRGPDGTKDSLNTYYDAFYKLTEPNVSSYTDIFNRAKSYSDTALVVIGRRAGETEDPPRVQYKNGGSTDTSRHYLEISTEEEQLLTKVGQNFEKTIVIINSTNCMELGFLDTIPGLDSCLVCGCTGNNGAYGIAELLFEDGDTVYSPSGKLSDTYPYSFDYNINVNHSGIEYMNHFSNAGALGLYPKGITGRNAGVSTTTNANYVDYLENIYIGYKWFETADKEGYWDRQPYNGYENVVQYPFGYGLSYTSFDWNLVSCEPEIGSSITNTDTIKLSVEVTNTGAYVGKDVVEAYVTAPYTSGEIEKSFVTMVGVNKTNDIQPGESEIVELEIKVSDFESYDCYDKNNNNFKGYELEAGEYQLKLMSDSHNVKQMSFDGGEPTEGILSFNVEEDIKVLKDEISGSEVNNLFTGESAVDGVSIDGTADGLDLNKYISRENFPNISTTKDSDRTIINQKTKSNNLPSQAQMSEWDNATVDVFGHPVSQTKPSWGENPVKLFNGKSATDLGLELGTDYDDPRWDKVLNGIPLREAVTLVSEASQWNKQCKVESIGHDVIFEDYDGPAQIKSFNAGDDRGTGFPNATVLAQAFSPNLSYQYGVAFGTDMNAKGADGVYGFGCNIHRSPFQGRNYEYLSEDGYLSGIILQNEIKGLNKAGKYTYLKHLVLAENEHEREGTYIWLTEQSLREIYLKPFKMAIQNEECVGLMSSYNRIGSKWTGSSEGLITGVIRNEWKFHGAIITDYSDHNQYMNHSASFRAGGNFGMACTLNNSAGGPSTVIDANSCGRLQNRLRDAVHQIIYMWLAPQTKANVVISSLNVQGWKWLEPLVDLNGDGIVDGTLIKILIYSLIGMAGYFVLRPIPPKEVSETSEASEKKARKK